jgi:hypothetical protein
MPDNRSVIFNDNIKTIHFLVEVGNKTSRLSKVPGSTDFH